MTIPELETFYALDIKSLQKNSLSRKCLIKKFFYKITDLTFKTKFKERNNFTENY